MIDDQRVVRDLSETMLRPSSFVAGSVVEVPIITAGFPHGARRTSTHSQHSERDATKNLPVSKPIEANKVRTWTQGRHSAQYQLMQKQVLDGRNPAPVGRTSWS
jgi:hypothetical protein